PAPYGGVALHAEGVVENTKCFTSRPLVSTAGYLLTLVDLPLTVVGDTVTLPWVLAKRCPGHAKPQILPPVGHREEEPGVNGPREHEGMQTSRIPADRVLKAKED